MRRNKLPFFLLAFVCALIYITGIMVKLQHKPFGPGMEQVGGIALICSLLLFFAIPRKLRK